MRFTHDRRPTTVLPDARGEQAGTPPIANRHPVGLGRITAYGLAALCAATIFSGCSSSSSDYEPVASTSRVPAEALASIATTGAVTMTTPFSPSPELLHPRPEEVQTSAEDLAQKVIDLFNNNQGSDKTREDYSYGDATTTTLTVRYNTSSVIPGQPCGEYIFMTTLDSNGSSTPSTMLTAGTIREFKVFQNIIPSCQGESNTGEPSATTEVYSFMLIKSGAEDSHEGWSFYAKALRPDGHYLCYTPQACEPISSSDSSSPPPPVSGDPLTDSEYRNALIGQAWDVIVSGEQGTPVGYVDGLVLG